MCGDGKFCKLIKVKNVIADKMHFFYILNLFQNPRNFSIKSAIFSSVHDLFFNTSLMSTGIGYDISFFIILRNFNYDLFTKVSNDYFYRAQNFKNIYVKE